MRDAHARFPANGVICSHVRVTSWSARACSDLVGCPLTAGLSEQTREYCKGEGEKGN